MTYATENTAMPTAVEIVNPTPGGYALEAVNSISADLFQRWIAYVDRTPKTIEAYTKAAKHFWQYLQERGIAQPTRETILEYKRDMAARGLKPSSINNYMAALRLFFKWTAQEGIYRNITENIHREKIGNSHKREALTPQQSVDLLDHMKRETLQEKRDFAIVFLMTNCGLRCVEVARANIEDIRAAGDRSAIYIQGKGCADKSQSVDLPPEVEKVIRDYLAARGEAKDSAPLFASLSHNSAGQRMTTRSISGICKAAMIQAGFNDHRHTAHSLRHTAVTLALIANGGNITEACDFARHSDISTTNIYNHSINHAQNPCARNIARLLSEAGFKI